VSHSRPNWIEIGTMAAGLVAVSTAWVIPSVRKFFGGYERWRKERLFLHGDKGIDGVRPATLTAIERVASLETQVTSIKTQVCSIETKLDDFIHAQTPNGENTDNVGDLIKRMARQMGVVLEKGDTKA